MQTTEGRNLCYVFIFLLRNLFLFRFLKEDSLEVLIFFLQDGIYLRQQFDESKQLSLLKDLILF